MDWFQFDRAREGRRKTKLDGWMEGLKGVDGSRNDGLTCQIAVWACVCQSLCVWSMTTQHCVSNKAVCWSLDCMHV